MKNRIYIDDWLVMKPYEKQTASDNFYLKICNDVKKAFIAANHFNRFQSYLSDEEIDRLCCFLTSYFEDLMSETNIWNSFIRKHHELYKKYLPFYEMEDYYDNEINKQDISFLIWYYLSACSDREEIKAESHFIIHTADQVFDVFEKAWDVAPSNVHLKSFYQLDDEEDNFFIVRELIDVTFLSTYLFYPDTCLRIQTSIQNFILDSDSDNMGDEQFVSQFNELRDNNLFELHTKLLGLSGKEWVSEILGKNHVLGAAILEISPKVTAVFFYKGQDEDNLFLEHIATGMPFEVVKKSYKDFHLLTEIDAIVYIGIVRWKNEWWFSGLSMQLEYNHDSIMMEKQSAKSKSAVQFLKSEEKEINMRLEFQEKSFLEFNGGSPLAFMQIQDLDGFKMCFYDFFTEKRKRSNLFSKSFKKRISKKEYVPTIDPQTAADVEGDLAVVFINPKCGIEVILNVSNAFPMPNNPFFNIENSEMEILDLLTSPEKSTELAQFCVEHFEAELPFFKSEKWKRYSNDFDFLLRFWKAEDYFSKPHFIYS